MQISTNELKGNAIAATDGDTGNVEDFYFDDKSWTIRYLVASTGGWFVGKSQQGVRGKTSRSLRSAEELGFNVALSCVACHGEGGKGTQRASALIDVGKQLSPGKL